MLAPFASDNPRLTLLRSIMQPSSASSSALTSAFEHKTQDASTSGIGSASLVQPVDAMEFERRLNLRTGADAIAFFAQYGQSTPCKFVYCNRAPQRSSTDYRPYELQVVTLAHIDPTDYYTISSSGVVHISGSEASEWTSLSEWMHQSALFTTLRSIRFFHHFAVSKTMSMWRARVRFRVYCKQRKELQRRLFAARPSFAPALMKITAMVHELRSVELLSVSSLGSSASPHSNSVGHSQVYSAEKFVERQSECKTLATKRYATLLESIEETLELVCKSIADRARTLDLQADDALGSIGRRNDDPSAPPVSQHYLRQQAKVKSMVALKEERQLYLQQRRHAHQEANMLAAFIRLVDEMACQQLCRQTIATVQSFLGVLLSIGSKSDSAQTHKALFQLQVSFTPDSLAFAPSEQEILAMMHGLYDGFAAAMDSCDRVLYHPKLKPFLANATGSTSPKALTLSTSVQGSFGVNKVSRLIHRDVCYNATRRRIDDKIRSDFAEMTSVVSFLERHRCVYTFGRQWSYEAYCATHSQHDAIAADMAQMTEWSAAIRRIRDLYEAGIFEAETRQLKLLLLPVTESALHGMRQLLLRLFHGNCIALHQKFILCVKELDDEPSQLPLFAAHVEAVNGIKSSAAQLLNECRSVESMHALMLQYDMTSLIPSQDSVLYDDLLSSAAAFGTSLQVAEQRIDDRLLPMRQTVYKNIARLNNEIETVRRTCSDNDLLNSASSDSSEVMKLLDGEAATLHEIRAQAATLQHYQVLFDTEPYPFHSLPQVQQIYERKRLLCISWQEWQEQLKTWSNADLKQLDTSSMQSKVNDMQALVAQFNREYQSPAAAAAAAAAASVQPSTPAAAALPTPSSAAVTLPAVLSSAKPLDLLVKLTASVQEFADLVPLITQLCAPQVKASHWRALLTSMSVHYFPSEKQKIKKLRAQGVLTLACKDAIAQLHAQAVGEQQLADSLALIVKQWSSAEFQTKAAFAQTESRAEQGDARKIANFPALVGMVTQDQSTVVMMRASPYALSVQAELDLWDKKLALLAQVLIDWQTLQAQWLTLEPILYALSELELEQLQIDEDAQAAHSAASQPAADDPDASAAPAHVEPSITGLRSLRIELAPQIEEFAQVDRVQREQVRRCVAQPNCMQIINTSSIAQQLTKATKIAEKCQAAVEEWRTKHSQHLKNGTLTDSAVTSSSLASSTGSYDAELDQQDAESKTTNK